MTTAASLTLISFWVFSRLGFPWGDRDTTFDNLLTVGAERIKNLA
jgi:hypothetical protein